MPDGLWTRCDSCKGMVYKKIVEERMYVCPECNYHFRVFSRDRLKLLLDENSFEEMWGNMVPCDPLNFKDRITYPERVAAEQQKTGLKEAAIVGKGKINGKELIIGITDSSFIMGSMGAVVGEKIARAAEKACELQLPLIIISGSGGGARMQEGVFFPDANGKDKRSNSTVPGSRRLIYININRPISGWSHGKFCFSGRYYDS